MKIEVLSLGGSLIVPKATDTIDNKFLTQFQQLISSFRDKKFVIVVGGGSTARKYITALEKHKVSKRKRCLIGIGITRLHAKFLTYFFGKDIAPRVPTNMQDIKKLLKKHKIVLTGALRFEEDNTSDGTAAKIAKYLKTRFINITDVKGLYDKDPKKHKNAKLISSISFKAFHQKISKKEYHPGQHFILDQHASKIIMRHRVQTIIIGKDLKNIRNCLTGKNFIGTVIR